MRTRTRRIPFDSENAVADQISLPFGSENAAADQIRAARTNEDPQSCCHWVLEGIVELHRDESTLDMEYSGVPRSVDAKANYRENQNLTW